MIPATLPAPTTFPLASFIARWTASGAAERANYQLFLSKLCDALDLPRPDPEVDDETRNAYVFEKTVPLPHGTVGSIDLYRRGGFVLEAKQGSDRHDAPPAPSQQVEQQRRRGAATRGTAAWHTAKERARQQAQNYARNLPADEVRDGRPPFLLVVDVGQSIAVYSEFSRSGGTYLGGLFEEAAALPWSVDPLQLSPLQQEPLFRSLPLPRRHRRAAEPHPPHRRRSGWAPQAPAGSTPQTHADRYVQRPGKAARKRGVDREGAPGPRAGAGPASAEQVAIRFADAPVDRVAGQLETLASLGQAEQVGEG